MNPAELPELLLAGSLRGSLLILLALPLVPWVRRWLGPDAAHYLWVAALLALLWPWPPRTPLSLANLLPARPAAVIIQPTPDVPDLAARVQFPLGTGNGPKLAKYSPALPVDATFAGPAMTQRATLDWRGLAVTVWAVGVFALLGRLGARWWETRQLLRSARSRELPAGVELPLRVRLAETARIPAPALCGVWRPTILLPVGLVDELSAESLQVVLLHELGHHRRRDLAWEWLFAVACCMHWINPLAWLVQLLARRERELACDAWVLERTRGPRQYGLALLEVLQRIGPGARSRFGAVAMADRRSPVALRMERIHHYRPRSRWSRFVAWVPALLVLGAVGSDRSIARAGQKESASAEKVLPTVAVIPQEPANLGPLIPLPISQRGVEITSRLLRLPESLAASLQLPIAEEGSEGVLKILDTPDSASLLKNLKGAPSAEILPLPRVVSRNGYRVMFESAREFRYPLNYTESTQSPGLYIPGEIAVTNVGLTMECDANFFDDQTTSLHIAPSLTRLTGFRESSGALKKVIPLSPDADWFDRITAWQMPPGAGGEPEFVQQRGEARFDLNASQAALVFGFRDIGESTANPPMVNYILVQMSFLP